MRKISFLLLAFAALFCGKASAQIDNTFVFTDKDGNVIADGSTVTATETEFVDDGMDGYYQINSGLYVKNTTDQTVAVGCDFSITRLDNGAPQMCFPMTCLPGTDHVGDYSQNAGEMEPNELRGLQTEWIYEDEGTCTMEFHLKVYDTSYNSFGIPSYTYRADGPSVTVNFVYSKSAGVGSVTASKDRTVVARYAADGSKLSAPVKGLNIVKYSDGTTEKVVLN